MTRKMTAKEILKVSYFTASLVALCIFCEVAPVAAVANLAIAARLLKTIDVESLIQD